MHYPSSLSVYLSKLFFTLWLLCNVCLLMWDRLSLLFVDSPRYRGLNGEVENWMQWIDDSNSDDLLDLPDDDIDAAEFIGG